MFDVQLSPLRACSSEAPEGLKFVWKMEPCPSVCPPPRELGGCMLASRGFFRARSPSRLSYCRCRPRTAFAILKTSVFAAVSRSAFVAQRGSVAVARASPFASRRARLSPSSPRTVSAAFEVRFSMI